MTEKVFGLNEGGNMIKVYDVQTFYGTKAKTFQHIYNAEKYYRKLCEECECVDPITTRELTTEEFVYENIED